MINELACACPFTTALTDGGLSNLFFLVALYLPSPAYEPGVF